MKNVYRPDNWHDIETIEHFKDQYGREIVLKKIDGKFISQVCRHGWIYEYIEGNLIEEMRNAPTPSNIYFEF